MKPGPRLAVPLIALLLVCSPRGVQADEPAPPPPTVTSPAPSEEPAPSPSPSPDGAQEIPHDDGVFRKDPDYGDTPYDAQQQLDIYGNKHMNRTQRPLIEWGRDLYQYGPFQPAPTPFGDLNPARPAFWLYGDMRTAAAFNQPGGQVSQQVATRLNLEADLRLTATERIHAFFRPLDQNGSFTRLDFSPGGKGVVELDGNQDALFFEGDAGAMAAGLTGRYSKLDLPFAVGLMPLLLQNGVWLEDAFTGAAFSIPARNSRLFDISNFDVTLFSAFDRVNTPAIPGNNANIFGITSFMDAMEGYLELGYAFVDDAGKNTPGNFSYHNFGMSFSKRYANRLSNTIRLIANVGQTPGPGIARTANGALLLIENSLVTDQPWALLPYFNLWLGLDRPQSVARDPGAGGILKNVGILFESDGLTNFPTMDASGNNTYGGAVGIQYLFDFPTPGNDVRVRRDPRIGAIPRQLVVEAATLKVMGNAATRIAPGDQYGLGVRYQHPLSNSLILRLDAMVAQCQNAQNIWGARVELRSKF